jgi:hypothetical protein
MYLALNGVIAGDYASYDFNAIPEVVLEGDAPSSPQLRNLGSILLPAAK